MKFRIKKITDEHGETFYHVQIKKFWLTGWATAMIPVVTDTNPRMRMADYPVKAALRQVSGISNLKKLIVRLTMKRAVFPHEKLAKEAK